MQGSIALATIRTQVIPRNNQDIKRVASSAQNPRERITLPVVMRHPWVTKRGAWPLQTVREMGGCPEEEDEINPQLVSLPDMMSTLNVLDIPRQVSACWILHIYRELC